MSRGKLLVISGPSGVGKGSITAYLRQEDPNKAFSVSSTTRGKREGEIDGVHYSFLTKAEFEKRISASSFLEWAKVYDNYYGTEQAMVELMLEAGKDVILDIDTVGAINVKTMMPEALLFFIMPPSREDLEARLRGRATDAEDVILKRLACFDAEVEASIHYDYIIINDDISRAAFEIDEIIKKHKLNSEEN